MSFVTALALGIVALVALPLLAHRLRRQRADERPFAAAHLVAPAPPRARRRARLEDRSLFIVRALAVAALALLGASPLVRCSRLSVERSSGASMALAIVLDDSMSMRAPASGGRTRFERAKDAASDLLAGAREGDAVAIVLAGAPPRVGLAATTDLAAARAALDTVAPSDRATDLDGAITIAQSLVDKLPQVDKRVIVLSDLADGRPDAPPVGESASLPVWVPLDDIAKDAPDCAVLSADDLGGRVRVRVACGKGASADGRTVEIASAGKSIASAPGAAGEITVALPKDAPKTNLVARLDGADAIAADDEAPVVVSGGPGALAIVADAAQESVATGGPPVLEQALSALRLDLAVKPIPAVPERAEDLAPFLGVILDDPPGLTPEQRRSIAGYMDRGGVVLLALGPRAAAAPLGASLEPIVTRAVTWGETSARGADADKARDLLGESTASLADLRATHRATLAPEDLSAFETLVPWSDGAPLVARRHIGRGEAWVVTLPFSADQSDLVLRPGFLTLLDAFADLARVRARPRRTDVGALWTVSPSAHVTLAPRVLADGSKTKGADIDVVRDGTRAHVSPPLIGAYHIKDGDEDELRVAAPVAREVDLRPRAKAAKAAGTHLGATRTLVDISSRVALALLALLVVELVLRARAGKPRGTAAGEDAPTVSG